MRTLLLVVVSLFLIDGVKAAPGTISQMPLGLQNSIPSNLMLLIDSSRSMTFDLKQTCMSDYQCSYYQGNYGTFGMGEGYWIGRPNRDGYSDGEWGERSYGHCSKLTTPKELTCYSSRIYMAKIEAKKLIDQIDGFYTGLMHFHYDRYGRSEESMYRGAILRENLTLIDSKDTNFLAAKNKLKSSIDNIVAYGGTPVAESFSAIGQYFAYNSPDGLTVTPTQSDKFKMTKDTDDSSYIFVSTPKSDPVTNVSVNTYFNSSLLNNYSGKNLPSYNASASNQELKNKKMAFKGWCQKSFAIGLTDGVPSVDDSSKSILEQYEQFKKQNNGTIKPYLVNNVGALWDMDLRPDLCDPLLLVELNDEFNLSMSSCSDLITTLHPVSGKSVYRTLEMELENTSDDNLVVNDGTLHRYKNNVRSYIIGFAEFNAQSSEDKEAINLMQTAARVGAGKYFTAEDGSQLSSVFHEILTTIDSTDSSASGIGLSLSSGMGDFIYRSRFNAADWSGDLGRYNLVRQEGAVELNEEDRIWSTDDEGAFPASHTDRVVLTFDPKAGVAIPFRWGSLPGGHPLKKDLKVSPEGTTDKLGKKRLNYIRGDQSNELSNNGSIGFRNRTSLLGDIVHSTPTFVPRIAEGVEYDPYNLTDPSLPSLTSRWNGSITRYTNGKTYSSPARNKDVVYVNANDGMLHAFDDEDGKEIFAYVPSFIASTEGKSGLHYLTDKKYEHRFYNDGTPWVKEDVWLSRNGKGWRTLLVNPVAAGGKGVSLLDITDVHSSTNPKESDAGDIVLWEFTHEKLGYTYSEPYIGPMRNGKWGVIIGNGYNSDSGTASVFIVDVEPDLSNGWVEGSNFYILETGVGQSDESRGYGKNGMSTVVAADVYQDPEGCDADKQGLHNVISGSCRTVLSTDDSSTAEEKAKADKLNSTYYHPGYGSIDRLYGGDLYGNLWAFNVVSTDPKEWTIDFEGKPLFRVHPDAKGNPQPITAPPRIAWAGPNLMRCNGYLKTLIQYAGKLSLEVVGAEFGDQTVTPYSTWDFDGLTIPDSSKTDDNGETEAVRRGLSCGPNIMVTFGTGQFLTEDDVEDKTPRAFYAVWDNYKNKLSNYPLTQTDLEQRIFATTTSTAGDLVRTIRDPDGFADGEFKLTQWDITDDYGWFVDFDQPGERLTSSPFYSAVTNEIMFSTIIPVNEVCGSGGISMFNRLDLLSGLPTKDVRVKSNVTKDGVIGYQLNGLNSGIKLIGSDLAGGGQFIAIAKSPSSGYEPIKIVNTEKEMRGIVSWYEIKQ